MAQGRAKLAWDPMAELLALMANINRNLEEKREPYSAADFHPYRTAADYQSDEKDKKARDGIKRTGKVTRLKHVGIVDRSWEGIPPVGDRRPGV